MNLREKLKAVAAEVDRLADEVGYEAVYQELFRQIEEQLNRRGGGGAEEILRLVGADERMEQLEIELAEAGNWI